MAKKDFLQYCFCNSPFFLSAAKPDEFSSKRQFFGPKDLIRNRLVWYPAFLGDGSTSSQSDDRPEKEPIITIGNKNTTGKENRRGVCTSEWKMDSQAGTFLRGDDLALLKKVGQFAIP